MKKTTAFGDRELYVRELNKGIQLTGESMDYFIKGRISAMKADFPNGFSPRKILDYGSGVGIAEQYLSESFPQAEIVGFDTDTRAVEAAWSADHADRVSFESNESNLLSESFDLCYVNGVFHHILPVERQKILRLIYSVLGPGGHLCFFENNPFNILIRYAMSRVPFDRQARLWCHFSAEKTIRAAGYRRIRRAGFLFIFPRFMKPLRRIEPLLKYIPLGAQYFIHFIKP